MTDNQIELLVDVINKSSFKDDLWVAIVSGGIILVTTTLITFIISRHESKKAKEEIKNRIELETLENLKAKRLFYVEQIEMTDLLNLENDIDSLHQIILDVYDKARMNDSFFGKGLVEKKKLGAMYLKEIPKLIKSISQRVKQYNFSEQEQGVIFQYIGMADSLRHEVMKSKTGEGFTYETSMQYFSDVEKLEGIVQNKRYTLFNKMKGVK